MPISSQIAIVIGSFHRRQAKIMLESALATAATHCLMVKDPVWVPGSMENPLALKRLLLEPSVDGAVVLGIIEQGQTAHGRVMGQAVINAILNLQLDLMKPIGVYSVQRSSRVKFKSGLSLTPAMQSWPLTLCWAVLVTTVDSGRCLV